MSDPKYKAPLAEQDFFLTPPLSDSQDCEDDIDLDIVANTYRSIIDGKAFDEMVAGWDRKLGIVDHPTGKPRVSRRLFGHLLNFREMLDGLAPPVGDDPLDLVVRDVPGPAMVISPNGTIAAVNVAGERAFSARQGRKLDPCLIEPGSQESLRALFRSARIQGNASHAIMSIVSQDKDFGHSILVEGFLMQLPGQSLAHIAIRSLDIPWVARVAERLQQAFSLTQAECDVARLFFQYRDPGAVAQQRNASLLTVRTQLKAIMAKTETPTSVDLMRLLAMIASREQIGLQGDTPHWHDPLDRERVLVCPDGRRIAWTWMGDRDGAPVVLLRGLTMAYLLSAEAEARLKEAGICVYLPSRPGYGNSSIDTSLDVMADNLIALQSFLDEVVGRPCLGVGQADGVLPLIVESAAHPERFHTLIGIGYAAGIDPSGLARLPKNQRIMLQLARTAPWIAELIARSGQRTLRQHGLDWYLERAFQNTPINQQTLRNPDWSGLIRNACEHALKQGHVAFIRELQLSGVHVEAALQALAVNFLYLAPLEDAGISTEACARLASLNPRISVAPVEAAGELILYQRSKLVTDRIIAAAR